MRRFSRPRGAAPRERAGRARGFSSPPPAAAPGPTIASALLEYARTSGSSLAPLFEAFAARRRYADDMAPDPAQAPAPASPGLPAERHAGQLVLPTTWKGTHDTSGADWNQNRATATDIMARAGTVVGAPEPVRVVRWGSAQGGEALYLDSLSDPDSDPDYWVGHVDQRVPVGTVVMRRGGRIAVVSSDHPAPHVHLDRIYR